MKATIHKQVSNGRNYSTEKETIGTRVLVANTARGLREAITVRFYMGRSNNSSRVYCSIWISGKDNLYTSGTGHAGGYGYHKQSAALAYAINSAGIDLDKDISGRGDSAMDEAMEAIARACGYNGQTLIVRNG